MLDLPDRLGRSVLSGLLAPSSLPPDRQPPSVAYPPVVPSRAASCTASGKAKTGFHPKHGPINALWLGDGGSAAVVPNSGTLRAGIETMKTAKGIHYREGAPDELQPQNRQPD